MLAYYKQGFDEEHLSHCIDQLYSYSNAGSLVQFLHITLNNLFSLLVTQTTRHDVSTKAFKALARIVDLVSGLDLPKDKHGRNLTLATYVQYVFEAKIATLHKDHKAEKVN